MSRSSHIVIISIVLVLIPTIVFAQSANEKLIQGIKAFGELDWEKSISIFNDTLQLGLSEKAQIEVYKYLGFCYIETDQQTKAKDVFESLLNLNPNYELDPNTRPIYIDIFKGVKSEFKPSGEKLLKDGIGAYNNLETKNAIGFLEESLKMKLTDDSKCEAYKYLAWCYIDNNQIDEAKKSFGILLDIKPDYQIGNEFSAKYREVFDIVLKEKTNNKAVPVTSAPSSAPVDLKPQTKVDKSEFQIIHGGQFKDNIHINSRLKLASFSLIMPGLGQYFGKRYISGTTFLFMEIGATVVAVIGYLQYNQSVDTYNNAIDHYHNVVTSDAVIDAEQAMIKAYNDAEKKFTLRQAGFIAVGSVWALNVLHVLIFGQGGIHNLSQTQIEFQNWSITPQVTPHTVAMSVRYPF